MDNIDPRVIIQTTRKFVQASKRARVLVCLCVCVCSLFTIDRAIRLTNEKKSVVAGIEKR